ncbi:nucleotide exchange factor GrpE [bacterium]|nr:nucleotide exchange factor GrpE [bacterium]
MNEFLFDNKPFDIMRPETSEGTQKDTEKPYITDLLKEIGKIRIDVLRMQKRMQSQTRQGPGGASLASSDLIDPNSGRDMAQALKFLEIILRDIRGIKPEITSLHDKIKNEITDDMTTSLFQVIDAFQRVFLSMNESEDGPQMLGWFKGIRQIYNTMMMTLQKYGIEEIECLGKKFDPKIHAAVGTVKDSSKANGTIVRVDRLGFIRNSIPMRFPEVIIVRNN